MLTVAGITQTAHESR